MKFSLKTKILSAVFTLSLVFAVLAPVPMADAQQIKRGLCGGAGFNVSARDCPTGNVQENKLNNLVTRIVNIISVIVGIVAVIMIIIGGFKYITSSGDSGNISSAKNTIIYAIVGLIIVALAQVIVRFVLSQTPSS